MLADVLEQDVAVKVLRRVVAGQIRYPLLLVGDEGVGRRFSVQETIKEMVALARGSHAPELRQVTAGIHPDIHLVTAPVDKEIGVDAAREVCQQAQLFPTASPHRFFIIDGADRMTPAAANAILKTLEELPAKSRFFLIAESYDQVLSTIRSRCGRVNYNKLSEGLVLSRLQAVEPDPTKALVYARLGEGSLGRSIRLWSSGRLALRDQALSILQEAVGGDYPAAFSVIDDTKEDLRLAFRFLRHIAHDLLVVSVAPSRVINFDIVEQLLALREKAPGETWVRVASGLKGVRERDESAHINLPFHLKSVLIDSLQG